MKRSADDSQVSVLLKDFEEADMLLAKVSASYSSTNPSVHLFPTVCQHSLTHL